MNQWTACMRGNGDPNQAVPTIDVSKVIKIIIPAGYMGTIDGPSGQDPSGAGVTCQSYLTAAQAALNGGQAPQQPSAAQLETWSECMRANGVSDYPDLGTGAGTVSGSPGSGGGFLNNPAFQHASQVCQQKTGLDIGNPGTGDSKPGQIEIYTSTGQLKLMSL
jgi:hypothetical protein